MIICYWQKKRRENILKRPISLKEKILLAGHETTLLVQCIYLADLVSSNWPSDEIDCVHKDEGMLAWCCVNVELPIVHACSSLP